MWHVHWCVLLLAPNHDQLSPIYLFKHCLLLVAVEVIYRVCHILWLLIISLILFYVEKNCCQELKISRCIHPSFVTGSGQASGLQISHPSTHLSSRLPLASPHYSASLSLSPSHFILALLPVILGTHKVASDDDQGEVVGDSWSVAFSAVWPTLCMLHPEQDTAPP